MNITSLLAGSVVALGSLAHPLGNFTSNTYAGLRVAPGEVTIDYVLDLAEIPTQQARQAMGGDTASYARDECAALAAGLTLTVGGRAVTVTSEPGDLSFPPGLAGLSTLRLECEMVADGPDLAGATEFAFHDGNLADRIGWHEVTVAGDGTAIDDADVPASSVSDRLRSYPAGQPSLAVRTASFSATPGGARALEDAGAARPAPRGGTVPGSDSATRLFSSLVDDRDLTLGFGLVAVALAIVLGAFHALAPGHGKTVIAAYVVGQRGQLRHAVGIGLSVAVTHTAGVLVLGLLLYSSEVLAPERIYPILGAASGLLVAAVGAALLVRVMRALRTGAPSTGHAHGTGPGQHTHPWLEQRVLVGAGGPPVDAHHDHDHDHGHGDHHHHHDHDEPQPPARDDIGWGSLLAMGFAGGMVPSPSAVIVLLGALTIGRAWFGLTLVVAYGVGLALTLLAAGLLLVRARAWLEPRFAASGRAARVARYLPVVTALAVLGGGLILAARAIY